MNSKQNEPQLPAQAGWSRKAGQVAGEVGFADKFVVLSLVGHSAQVREEIEAWLDSRGLALNASKTRTVDLNQEGIRFPGFGLKVRQGRNGRRYTHVEASGESCQARREKVRGLLNHRTEWRAIADVVGEVNALVRGWSGYFHYGNSAGGFGKRAPGSVTGCGAGSGANTGAAGRLQALHSGPTRGAVRTLELAAPRGLDERMKAKGQTTEWNSESRVRENRLHSLMRGRSRKGTEFCASFRHRLSPTLLGVASRSL